MPDETRVPDPAPSRGRALAGILPGLVPPIAIAAVAWPIGVLLPLVGAPVAALVLGVLASGIRRLGAWPTLRPGVRFAGKRVLQSAIVVLGLTVSLGRVAEIGLATLPVLLGTLALALAAAWLLARAFGIGRDLGALIGVGTSICGASAIAAVAPILAAPSTLIALSISTVFLYNLLAVLAFPWLGHALGMSQEAFGLFAGTAVNDTSSVVAAASIYGPEAAQTAVVVKLARTLMIVPISLALAWLVQRQAARGASPGAGSAAPGAARTPAWRLIPWFIVGFLVAAGIGSTGLIPEAWQPGIHLCSTLLIAVALAAIGLEVDLAAFRRAGWRPLAFGGMLWLIITGSCLALMALTGWLPPPVAG